MHNTARSAQRKSSNKGRTIRQGVSSVDDDLYCARSNVSVRMEGRADNLAGAADLFHHEQQLSHVSEFGANRNGVKWS